MPLPDDLPWVRLWVRTDSDTGSETGGFSYAFDEGLSDSLPEHFPHPLERLRTVPVLVLLGEAGMGKSNALHREHKRRAACPHGVSHMLDLSEFASEDRLRDRLQNVLEYRSDDQCLVLHLDSFDECRLDIRNLARLLQAELEDCGAAPHALQLRIASRSAEWPSSLTAALQRIWGESSVEVRELLPLKRNDAAMAASAAGLDAEIFLEAVRARDCESLACRPKTLAYLIDEHRRSGSLPARRWDLYAQGIRTLCEEDLRRHDNERGGHLTSGQRMQLAEELAVVMIFANRGGFFLESHGVTDATGLLPLSILVENERPFAAPAATVDALRETLRVGGLFERRTDGAVQFRHHSDAEFLAASFLRRSNISARTTMSLLRDPVGQWLPPQLVGVAAWVAEYVQDVRDWLIREYPVAFLAADATIDDDTRAMLVQSLLELARARAEVLRVPEHRLARLEHPGLRESLNAAIVDGQAHLATRYLALEIAEACGLARALAPQCVALLHDRYENEALRAKAARILCRLVASAQPNAIAALLPYVQSERDDDPEGRFRAMALEALWPDHIGAETFFAALNPRHRGLVLGSHALLPQRLQDTLRKEHLPAALDWVAQLDRAAVIGDLTLQKVADTVMRHAWTHLDDDSILRRFTEAARASLERHEALFNRAGERDPEWEDPFSDTGKRRRVIEQLVELNPTLETLRLPAMYLLRDEDIPWLIDGTPWADARERELRAQLVHYQYRYTIDPAITDRVLEQGGPDASAPIAELKAALGDTFKPIDPYSEHAARLREQLRYQRSNVDADDKGPKRTPTRRQQIDAALQLLESDPVEGWCRLTLALDALPEGAGGGWSPSCLPDAPGWTEFDRRERDNLPSSALRYLSAQTPSSLFLETPRRWTVGDIAAYAAFDLIANESHDKPVEEDIIRQWLPILLSYPFAHQDNQYRRTYLLRWLTARESDAFVAELRKLIEREAREESHGFTRTDEFDAVWSPEVADTIRNLAFDEMLPLGSRVGLWRWLLQHQDSEVANHLQSTIADGTRTAEATHAAALLLEEWPNRAWETVASFLEANPGHCKEVVQTIADRYRRVADTWYSLSPDKQALLYKILERTYPHHEERTPATGAYMVGTRDHVRDLKGFILDWIKNAGSDASVKALDDLIDTFPEHEWLNRYRNQAVTIAREAGWRAPNPKELMELLADDRRTVVRSDEELLSVVIESLAHLQDRLHRSTPMAPFLWDEEANKPKVEDRLSDFVKDHLRMDLRLTGVIIQREVEVRNLSERGVGERPDLLVEAVDVYGHINALVIEVKCEWHPQLESAMDKQLLRRYLKGAGFTCGLYLVGWTGTKPRKFPSPDDLRNSLWEQEAALSAAGTTIRSHVLDVSRPGH